MIEDWINEKWLFKKRMSSFKTFIIMGGEYNPWCKIVPNGKVGGGVLKIYVRAA